MAHWMRKGKRPSFDACEWKVVPRGVMVIMIINLSWHRHQCVFCSFSVLFPLLVSLFQCHSQFLTLSSCLSFILALCACGLCWTLERSDVPFVRRSAGTRPFAATLTLAVVQLKLFESDDKAAPDQRIERRTGGYGVEACSIPARTNPGGRRRTAMKEFGTCGSC